MGNDVFANGREISCKAADGKAICAFPDVCLSPPSPPAGPIPIPYPNSGFAKDATSGSKSVQISGKEVILKNKSYFKKSTGDEAATKSLGMGVVTHQIQGKVYFNSWSMDVKIEGENAVRHLDLTTHNHASPPGQTPPWPYTDEMVQAIVAECGDEIAELERACARQSLDACDQACKNAQKCLLPPKGSDKQWCCKPNNTGHHMIEDHWVDGVPGFEMAHGGPGSRGYKAAPTVCANRFRSVGSEHRELHNVQGIYEESFMPGGARHRPGEPSGGWNYREGKKAALNAHDAAFGDSKCRRGCLEAQLDAFYGDDGTRPLKQPSTQGVGAQRGPLLENWGPSLGSCV